MVVSMFVLEGLRPWVIQRISAVVIAAWLVYVVVCLMCATNMEYLTWREWLYTSWNSLFTGLFILALLFHAWIGMRDVVLDYIHNVWMRLGILSAIIVTLLVCGLWSLRILLLPVT